ncbi:MAG TPA: lipopolysaccharide heptosyltransferase II, partial [Candidatus Acidoferrum sp.]|nr:lipopolysaccharide heptosyltransferase II [Candidatus Acidoferrum sp.]
FGTRGVSPVMGGETSGGPGMLDIDPKEIRRILVREVNWVGDGILTLPALEALDRRFPKAEISVLARSWVAGLFAKQPTVDRVIEYRPDVHRGPLGRWRLAGELRGWGFDLAVLLPNSLDAALIPWMAGIPRRVGYPTDGRRIFLTHPVRPSAGGVARHQVEYYLNIVRALGGDGRPVPRLHVASDVRAATIRLLGDNGLRESDILVALNPGALYGTAKQWPADRFAAVADALVDGWDARIALIGSRREVPILEEVVKRMRRPGVMLGCRTDLATFMGLLDRAQLLLTNYTGAMHVAAYMDTPTLAVFGPTDVETTGPLGCRSRVVREPVPCSPCLLRECPIDHRCMTGVSVEQVLQAAGDLLETALGSRLSALGSPGTAPAAFLDRDGTIIEDPGYLADPEGIRFIPGSREAVRALQDAGFRLFLVTNQAGVARGLLSEADVRRVNERLESLLAEDGVHLDGVYYCPHHPEYGPAMYRRDCDWRKPGPGMILRAAREFPLDLPRSVIVGDHLSDARVADAFPGMRGVLLLTGHGRGQLAKIEAGAAGSPAHIAQDLRAAVDWVLARVEHRDAIGSPPA